MGPHNKSQLYIFERLVLYILLHRVCCSHDVAFFFKSGKFIGEAKNKTN